MRTIFFSFLLLLSYIGMAQTQYCVVATGRLFVQNDNFYSHVATYADSTVDLTKRIDKDTLSVADVIFYFVKDGWELVTLNQYVFPTPGIINGTTLPSQGGEYFYLVFSRED